MFVLSISDAEMKKTIDIELNKPSIPSIKFEKFINEVPSKIIAIEINALVFKNIWSLGKLNIIKIVNDWIMNLIEDFKEK